MKDCSKIEQSLEHKINRQVMEIAGRKRGKKQAITIENVNAPFFTRVV